MQPFSFTAATSPQQASEAQTEASTAYLGGGTCIIDLMKLYVMRPEALIDVRKVAAPEIKDLGATVLIPATATNTAVANSPLVVQEFPVLSEALLSGASPQLRNAATIGGNVMQRTRCYYFRDTAMRCNKREPGSGCDALDGFNRMNAVLGGSDHCIAVNPSDMNVAMSMLDAVVHVLNGNSRREIPFVDFHTLPGDQPQVETILKPGDLITAIEIKKGPLARNSHYLKVRDRAQFSFALASAAVAMEASGGTIKDARLALGGVATKPWRAGEAEKFLAGKPRSADSFRQAAQIALSGAVARKWNGFKVDLAKSTVVRAFEELHA